MALRERMDTLISTHIADHMPNGVVAVVIPVPVSVYDFLFLAEVKGPTREPNPRFCGRFDNAFMHLFSQVQIS